MFFKAYPLPLHPSRAGRVKNRPLGLIWVCSQSSDGVLCVWTINFQGSHGGSRVQAWAQRSSISGSFKKAEFKGQDQAKVLLTLEASQSWICIMWASYSKTDLNSVSWGWGGGGEVWEPASLMSSQVMACRPHPERQAPGPEAPCLPHDPRLLQSWSCGDPPGCWSNALHPSYTLKSARSL